MKKTISTLYSGYNTDFITRNNTRAWLGMLNSILTNKDAKALLVFSLANHSQFTYTLGDITPPHVTYANIQGGYGEALCVPKRIVSQNINDKSAFMKVFLKNIYRDIRTTGHFYIQHFIRSYLSDEGKRGIEHVFESSIVENEDGSIVGRVRHRDATNRFSLYYKINSDSSFCFRKVVRMVDCSAGGNAFAEQLIGKRNAWNKRGRSVRFDANRKAHTSYETSEVVRVNKMVAGRQFDRAGNGNYLERVWSRNTLTTRQFAPVLYPEYGQRLQRGSTAVDGRARMSVSYSSSPSRSAFSWKDVNLVSIVSADSEGYVGSVSSSVSCVDPTTQKHKKLAYAASVYSEDAQSYSHVSMVPVVLSNGVSFFDSRIITMCASPLSMHRNSIADMTLSFERVFRYHIGDQETIDITSARPIWDFSEIQDLSEGKTTAGALCYKLVDAVRTKKCVPIRGQLQFEGAVGFSRRSSLPGKPWVFVNFPAMGYARTAARDANEKKLLAASSTEDMQRFLEEVYRMNAMQLSSLVQTEEEVEHAVYF
jgi:hypothetical protein